MFKKLSFFLVGGLLALASCQQEAPAPCAIDVNVQFPQYTKALLVDTNDAVLDSATVADGALHFSYSDTLRMPFVARVVLNNANDPLDFMTMPIVVERGRVYVELGEYITTSGTPLNITMQHYLNDFQAVTDSLRAQDLSVDSLRASIANFFLQQIELNKENVVGEYIKQSFEASSFAKADTTAVAE